MSSDQPVTLAVVIGAHGVTGEVRLKVFAEDLSTHRRFNGGALTLKSVRGGPNGTIARFAEVADRNAAEALRGTELSVPRSALPSLGEGEYYHVDLLGLPAVSDEGAALGKVVAIDNFGAGDVLEIERPADESGKAKRFMVPMIPAAVPEWDAERLVVSAAFVE
ncbi:MULTISPECIES: ribosome maturation factor RimM [unclassified Sphingomonas]|uniref:ribosome maturation factor RimM n=1 Tax=Sphingomonas TaxID=13687 RepID=UPI000969C28F|nr:MULTISPECIES: ribosome maturation factor RimM [unclassified Sphingomonas]MBN8811500.1 16S rRNA processing protein RimM [Sphingomonas sp.]OJY49762.1 MAG: 16S rRNA processing protein RimM [Sphingomonas sp. 67-41]